MKPKFIVFDMDGTLLDVWERYYFSVVRAMSDFKLSPPPMHVVKSTHRKGFGIRHLLEIWGVPSNLIGQVNVVRWDYTYRGNYFVLDKLIPRRDTLVSLRKKVDLGVLTGYDSLESVRGMLSLNGVGDIFCLVRLGPRSTKSETLPKMCAELALEPKDCWMVGDSAEDILAAKNSGIRAIGVDYGMTDPYFLMQAGADQIISDIKELLDYV